MRRAALGIICTLAIGFGLHAQAPAPPANALRAGDIVIVGGQRFDTTREAMVPNTGLVVRSGIFLEVDSNLTGRDLGPAQVVRLDADQYVLPGFFDLHAHYAIDLFGAGRVDEYTVNPVVFLANGVTSTFPAGEVDPEGMYTARRRIERGEQIGARIHSSGPYFGTARPSWKSANETPEQIRKEVDEWAGRGVKGFKAKGIQPPQLLALIDQAHRYGLTVTGHLDSGFRNSVNPRDAIYMGIDRVEHFMGGDAITGDKSAYASLEGLDVTRPEVDAIIDLYLKRNVYYDATVSAYGYWYDPKDARVYTKWVDELSFLTPHAREVAQAALPRRPNEQFKRIYETKMKEVKRFYDKGGARLITVGTDHPSWGEFLSGFGTHRELHALVLAGIPPAAALKMATINAAHALRMSDQLGSIEPGKLADLAIVRGNPLADITNTRNVERVMVAGVLRDAKALLESVKGKMGPASAADDDWWKGNLRLK
jgi:imidazolonepropionase-like amidohydrolase